MAGQAGQAVALMFYFLHSTHMLTIRLEISTDDNILRSPYSLFRSLHSLLRSPHSLFRNLHRSKDIPPNILHRSMDILHSKHVCRLADKLGERADGRVHNSTVH